MSSVLISGDTSGAITISAPLVAGSGTLTLPTGTDTLVGLAATQTLTNKTLTTPNLGTPSTLVLTNATGLAAAAMPAGSVLQVVSTFKNDIFSSTSTSYVDITSLSVSITPASASNKILVLISLSTATSAGITPKYNLLRGASNIAQPSGGTGLATAILNTGSSALGRSWSLAFLDSPATTSSTTYKLQGKTDSGTFYVNQRGDDVNSTSVSAITVMEIKG